MDLTDEELLPVRRELEQPGDAEVVGEDFLEPPQHHLIVND